jgi:hypothetical protein
VPCFTSGVEVTAERHHSPGTPLSAGERRGLSNSSPDPITGSRSVLDTSTSFGPASALTRTDVHGYAADVISADLALAGAQPGMQSSCPITSGDSRRTAVRDIDSPAASASCSPGTSHVELRGLEPPLLTGKIAAYLRFRSNAFRFSPARYLPFRSRVLTASRGKQRDRRGRCAQIPESS